MTDAARVHAWRDAWYRRSVVALLGFTVTAILIGFVWLPAGQDDFSAQGLWASICRAAGAPAKWGGDTKDARVEEQATEVVLVRSMAADGTSDAVGRGATLAQSCTVCHGAQGLSTTSSPNLAGQYPEVIIKQLHDFRSNRRASPVMQAISAGLPDRDIVDLAAYYAYLPKARTAPTTYDENLPKLVRVGDPMRNIAPCIACHGGVDQKLGAPWLEGMPRAYLVAQLTAFASGTRHNDSEAQMRTMVRAMTPAEMDEVARFYAGKSDAGLAR